jgi:hypothetical protein
MRSLVALFKHKAARYCRDCGDSPCVCDCGAEDREARFQRELRHETDLAFAQARAENAAFWAKYGPEAEE